MLISPAFAQAAETVTQAEPVSQTSGVILQMVLLFAILYFLLIRPQQKRLRKHEAELKAIIRGTRIVVNGLLGTVVEIRGDDKLLVEFADGVQIEVLRPYVSQVITESSPLDKKKK